MTNAQTPPIDSAEFIVAYEGDALAEHTMSVRDLAPALLALGEAFDRANDLLNGNRSAVSLEIRATQQGSFELVLILESAISAALPVLSGDFVTAAVNMKGLFFSGGLISLIKRLRGAAPRVVGQENGNLILEIDRLRLEVPPEVLRLYNDPVLRKQLEPVVQPVARNGIDRVVFRDRQQTLESVEKGDVSSFVARNESSEEAITTETVFPRQRLRPAAVTFERDGKWRLNDGERTRWYAMNDTTFAEEVADGRLRFGSGDTLVCDVIARQTIEPSGQLRMEYEVARVIEHVPAPPQPQRRTMFPQ